MRYRLAKQVTYDTTLGECSDHVGGESSEDQVEDLICLALSIRSERSGTDPLRGTGGHETICSSSVVEDLGTVDPFLVRGAMASDGTVIKLTRNRTDRETVWDDKEVDTGGHSNGSARWRGGRGVGG
jgi:hypothetical protein